MGLLSGVGNGGSFVLRKGSKEGSRERFKSGVVCTTSICIKKGFKGGFKRKVCLCLPEGRSFSASRVYIFIFSSSYLGATVP